MGFLMRSRDHETVTLALSSPTTTSITAETYEVLNLIEFSTDRRRMSVIVRFPDGRICVICKGADSVIIERLKMHVEDGPAMRETDVAPSTENRNTIHPPDMHQTFAFPDPRRFMADHDDAISIPDEILVSDDWSVIENCIRSVNKFANESLRTLLYAYRFLEEKEYAEWRKSWDAATASLSDHENMVERAGELIEVNFELAGVTAIEDKLQQGVSETIDKLCRANIKIWMLTGDKRETAINISHSCGLIKGHSTILVLNDENGPSDMVEMIRSSISTLKMAAHSVVVVDGDIFATICNTPSGLLEEIFFDLVILSDSVICCRAQPSQKAQLVKRYQKTSTQLGCFGRR
jgi:phospholipid-translocating ATPase